MIAQLDRIAANPRITESRYQRAKRTQIQYAENILNSKGGSNAYRQGFDRLVIIKPPDVLTWGLMADNLRRDFPPYLFSMYFYYST